MRTSLSVDVWSDIACPWCYIGKRRLESALARFAHRDSVEVVWHAFELDPSAPPARETSQPYVERLAKKYGSSVAHAQTMIQRVVDLAALEGLPFDFEHIRPGNSFDAHRLAQLAAQHGPQLQAAIEERLLRAYLCEGQNVGDHATLLRLATEVGLDADAVQGLLATDLYAAQVRADEREAQALGVDGVPFFVFDRRYAVAGAQPAELLLSALERAWAEHPPAPVGPSHGDGPSCGPDGCA